MDTNPNGKYMKVSDVFNLCWLSSLTSSLLVLVAQPDKELLIFCPSYCVRRVSVIRFEIIFVCLTLTKVWLIKLIIKFWNCSSTLPLFKEGGRGYVWSFFEKKKFPPPQFIEKKINCYERYKNKQSTPLVFNGNFFVRIWKKKKKFH